MSRSYRDRNRRSTVRLVVREVERDPDSGAVGVGVGDDAVDLAPGGGVLGCRSRRPVVIEEVDRPEVVQVPLPGQGDGPTGLSMPAWVVNCYTVAPWG